VPNPTVRYGVHKRLQLVADLSQESTPHRQTLLLEGHFKTMLASTIIPTSSLSLYFAKYKVLCLFTSSDIPDTRHIPLSDYSSNTKWT
jgi:hypothetical protein